MLFNIDDSNEKIMSREKLLKKIDELSFACTDLNLFLDTHPNCQEALELFKQCAFTLKNFRTEYQNNYGPLEVNAVWDNIPFAWVADNQPWPWEKEE